MNLQAWQAAATRDPGAAAHEFLHRAQRLTAAQKAAIWAWQPTEAELTQRIAAGLAGPLRGAPYALKDLFHVKGVPTRAGGKLPQQFAPPAEADGDLVMSLTAAGAALAGKTHLHEFAYGLTGENPHYGDVDHPAFPGRTSGGSSSGSAAVVAAGMVPFAIGTDTGGSIRVPAAFCGLFGLRFTPGHRWMKDGFPLAPSFDTAGWMTRTREDMHAITDAVVGLGEITREPRGVWLGCDALDVAIAPDVEAALQATADTLAPRADAAVGGEFSAACASGAQTYSVLQSIEAYAAHEAWLDRYRECYGAGVWRLIDRGRNWTDEQRGSAQTSLAGVRRFWSQFFLGHDFLVLPASPFPALKKADCTPENRARLLTLTAPASLGGLPVLTVPVPLKNGLTTGLQIIVNSPHSPVIPWALRRCANCYDVAS